MTPKELLKIGENEYLAGLSEEQKTLRRYMDKECVVAYRKSFLGIVFLIKGKIEIFGFVILKQHLKWGNRELLRKPLSTIQRLFNEDSEEKVVVIDNDNFRIFERRVLLDGLKDDE